MNHEIDVLRKKHHYSIHDVAKLLKLTIPEIIKLVEQEHLVPEYDSAPILERIAKGRMQFSLGSLLEFISRAVRQFIREEKTASLLEQIVQQNIDVLHQLTKLNVHLLDYEPLSPVEVSKMLNMTVGAVQNACRRGEHYLDIPGFRKVPVEKRGKHWHIDKKAFLHVFHNKDYLGFHAKIETAKRKKTSRF